MNILGINYGHPDTSAILLKDGEWLLGSEEERFKRVKHWDGFPVESIQFCLEDTDISFDQLDFITVAGDISANLFRKLIFLAQDPNHLWKRKYGMGGFNEQWNHHFPQWDLSNKCMFVEHHRAHIASAFFGSPFEEALIFSIDGAGDFSTSMWGIGQGNKIDIKGKTFFPHSYELFYTAGTQYLGFQNVGTNIKLWDLPLWVNLPITGNY